ncbi:MAG: hypothetical protein MEEGG_00717 [Eggerthella lenta]
MFVLDFGKGLLSGVLAWAFSWYLLPGGGLEPGSLVSYDTMLTGVPGLRVGHIFSPGSSSRAARASRWPWAACSSCSAGWAHGSSLPSSSCWWLPRSTCRSARSRRRWPAPSSPVLLLGRLGRGRFVHDSRIDRVWAHRENIVRLRAGTERIGDRRRRKLRCSVEQRNMPTPLAGFTNDRKARRESYVKIAVIGAGSWGTALAQVLAENGHNVGLWARKPEVVQAINAEHRNPRYLSDVELSENIVATVSYQDALLRAKAAVIVTPSNLMRGVARALADVVDADFPVIICSKGVEEGSGLLPVEVFEAEMGNAGRLAVLSGRTMPKRLSGHSLRHGHRRTPTAYRLVFPGAFAAEFPHVRERRRVRRGRALRSRTSSPSRWACPTGWVTATTPPPCS